MYVKLSLTSFVRRGGSNRSTDHQRQGTHVELQGVGGTRMSECMEFKEAWNVTEKPKHVETEKRDLAGDINNSHLAGLASSSSSSPPTTTSSTSSSSLLCVSAEMAEFPRQSIDLASCGSDSQDRSSIVAGNADKSSAALEHMYESKI